MSQSQSAGETTFDGFISYSHAADGLLAPRLQSGLQQFAKPWWKRRAVRIFRDESSLSANPHLWSSITEALDSSEWFVLLLSPDAANSEWVNREIEYWREHKDPSRILPVLTDGSFEWSGGDVSGSAVPDRLRGAFSEEPRWVDLRFAQDETDLDLKAPRFADAVADIASALRGVPKDELASEEVKQHRRTIRTAWAGATLVGLLAVAAVFAAIQSSRNAAEAERQAEIAEENAALAAQNEEQALAQADRADTNAIEADRNAVEAERASKLAIARELAASAINVLSEDPQLSVLLALTAIDQTPEGFDQPVEVVDGLWRAVSNHRLLRIIDPEAGDLASIDLSRDGSTLAVSNVGGARLQVYDTENFEVLWDYGEITPDSFFDVRFSPDGSLLALSITDSEAFTAIAVDPESFPELAPALGGDDKPARVHIFEVVTGELVHTLSFQSCKETEVTAWSPDGAHLVVTQGPPGGSGERCVRAESQGGQWAEVFDTSTWESVGVIDTPMDEGAFDSPIPAFDEDGRLYIFGWSDGPRIYTANGYELIADREEPAGVVAVSPDGTLFASVGFTSAEWSPTITEVATGETFDRLTGADARPNLPNGLSFSSDGRLLHAVTNGADIYVWDVSSGEQLFRLRGGDGGRAIFDVFSSRLFTSHADGLVRVWNLGQSSFGRTPIGDLGSAEWVNGTPFTIGPELGMFEAIDIEGGEGFVMLFDLETGEIQGPKRRGNDQLALPDGRFIYNREYNEYVVLDPETGSETYLFGCETEDFETCIDSQQPWINYRNVVLAIGGDQVVAASVPEQPGTPQLVLTVFDSNSLEEVGSETLEVEFFELYAISDEWVFYDDGRQGLVIERASGDTIWESGLRTSRYNESPSRRLASVLAFNTVHIIELGTWESRALPFDFGEVRGMAFNSDETMLALGDERQLSIVDLTSDEIIQRVPIEGVSDAFWLDDESLVVGTEHGDWAVISLDITELVADARSSLLRSFTDQECLTYRIDPCPSLEEMRGG